MELTKGQSIGNLTLEEFHPKTNGGSWLCKCSCGTERLVNESALAKTTRAQIRGCGCRQFKGSITHGRSKTPEYRIWAGMIARCTQPKQTSYPYYGGRGIIVCDRWLKSFEDFLTDVGLRPAPEYSLDRINPDGNYELTNVRWATPLEQQTNRRWRYMTLRKYQHEAGKTADYLGRNELSGLIYTVLGLAGESGEVANKAKKILRGDAGWEITADIRKTLIDEASDVLWYLSQLCHELDVTLEDVARFNLRKLQDRKKRGVIKGSGDNR